MAAYNDITMAPKQYRGRQLLAGINWERKREQVDMYLVDSVYRRKRTGNDQTLKDQTLQDQTLNSITLQTNK